MLARVTTFQGRLERADEGARIFQEGIPAIRDLDGFKDAVLLLDRQSGEAMTIALWQDEQTLIASAAAAGDLFRQAADTIEGEPERQLYEVVDYRPGENRRFARVSTGSVKPEWFEQQDDGSIIDAASRQPGYAGFLVLADREQNQIIGMSFWDSQEHLESSESGYYTAEMEKSREQFEGGQWERAVYEVAAQS